MCRHTSKVYAGAFLWTSEFSFWTHFFPLTKRLDFVIIKISERSLAKGGLFMKLIIAIVNNDDAHFVNTGLTSEGFHITKVSSTGGFLLNGNSTFFIGTEDDRVERALEIIRVHSKKRVKNIPTAMPIGTAGALGSSNTNVSVGGATVFIIDVEKFYCY